MGGSRTSLPSWISAAATRVDFEGNVSSMSETAFKDGKRGSLENSQHFDADLGVGERALSAAGAAVLSAIIVNPLDVAKTRLQAQAAGVPYQSVCRMACFETNTMLPDMRCSMSGTPVVPGSEPVCPSTRHQYKGTLDVFYKVIRQEGFTRLWRGTYASLALAVPTVGIYLPCYDIFRNLMEDFTIRNAPNLTGYVPLVAGSVARSLACVTCYPVELARTRMQAFKEAPSGKPPGVWKTLVGVINPTKYTSLLQNFQSYRFLWTGLGAQLARDVPYSAICWSTLEPTRKKILGVMGDKASAANVLGANFSAGFIAGCLAGAATCPLDVVKTRRQIEKDPYRAINMTTRKTLLEIWRDGGMKGLFTGIRSPCRSCWPFCRDSGLFLRSCEICFTSKTTHFMNTVGLIMRDSPPS
ncbi:Mitochondrial carrier protein [Quillaja saponaria]|uniref:Mitochondrial carrier protein n=1 Tax=Quillaja saponaria TaxID=32244 RepID=A0AAD7LQV6_QUISA|nr:Mitochondrial carrier protein [Quillaja saponaria]